MKISSVRGDFTLPFLSMQGFSQEGAKNLGFEVKAV